MTSTEREPSRDELLAMAYADGELAGEERAGFERRLAGSPELGREVARYRRLQALARQLAPAEPMDYEWRRLAADPLQRLILTAGWTLLVVAGVVLVGWGEYEIAVSDMPLVPKLALAGLLIGGVLLVVGAVRGRLRTRPYDPYTEVQR